MRARQHRGLGLWLAFNVPLRAKAQSRSTIKPCFLGGHTAAMQQVVSGTGATFF
jgi:hypothetical protein